jgi:hypothetical protein
MTGTLVAASAKPRVHGRLVELRRGPQYCCVASETWNGMVRFVSRLLSIVALSASVVLAVVDAARCVAASALVTTPLSVSWGWVSPGTLASLRETVSTRFDPLAWDVVANILGLPGFVVFAALALVFYAISHRPGPAAGQPAA